MDTAIVRGRVSNKPEYIRNGGEQRCVFTLAIELPSKLTPEPGKKSPEVATFTTMTCVTEPFLVPCCEALLDKNDEVVVMGQFGVIKDRLKMRVVDIDLPEVALDLGITGC